MHLSLDNVKDYLLAYLLTPMFLVIDQRCVVAVTQTGDASRILTGPEESLRSHFLCFAAEKSRLERRVIDLTSEQIAL